jgi:hypothetical protein
MTCMPCRLSGLIPNQASIENAATPIPASPVAPVPTRPTAFGHQIDKVGYTNPEQGGVAKIGRGGANTATKAATTTINAANTRTRTPTCRMEAV